MFTLADTDETAKVVNRLRRVEGQARGLQRMLAEGRSCDEVFTQLSAMKAALDRVATLLISLEMRACLADEIDADDAKEAVDKALQTFVKYSQCIDCTLHDAIVDQLVRA
jgi:DNA-binding FrmR family transcriptional regulator